MGSTEFNAELTITSQTLNPEQIGSRIGLKKKGLARPLSWQVGPRKDESLGGEVQSGESTLKEHVAGLPGRLTPHVLSGEQVDLISAMGANFWADVYFLADD